MAFFLSDQEQKMILETHIANGVQIQSLNNTYIGREVQIEPGAIIYANNHIDGNTVIKSGAKIMPFCNISNSIIGENTVVTSSTLCDAKVGSETTVGPNAYLRPKAVVGNHCKIGDFVEVKNASIADRTKASHLTYIGDADIGEDCNIGCGVIFVNYNGKGKNRTTVGNNVFVGSNTNVIAPVVISDNVYIAAGSTVTENLNSNDFVIGRCRPSIKPNRAEKYLGKKI